MTEERSCNNCGIDLICQECDMGNSNWQPIAQEKPMEDKVIFESEEECAEFLCNVYNHSKEYCLRSLVPMAKQKGYIRKSVVEEAEEMYREWLNRIGDMSENVVMEMDKMYSAIQEFKSEIARGKK